MRRVGAGWAIGLSLLLRASSAGAAGEAPLSGWAEPQQAQARAELARLASAGVEEAAALDRLREWQAKGADPARSLELLARFAQASVEARTALEAEHLRPSSALVETAASAVLAGASGAELSRAVRGASPAEAQDRVLALASLVAQGFPSAASTDLVVAAGERGFRGEELAVLVGSAQRLAREQVAPSGELLARVGSAVRQGVPARQVYPSVQQALRPARSDRPAPPEAGFNHPVLRSPSK